MKIRNLQDLEKAKLLKQAQVHEQGEIIRLKWAAFTKLDLQISRPHVENIANLGEFVKTYLPISFDLLSQVLVRKYVSKSSPKLGLLISQLNAFLILQLDLFLNRKTKQK